MTTVYSSFSRFHHDMPWFLFACDIYAKNIGNMLHALKRDSGFAGYLDRNNISTYVAGNNVVVANSSWASDVEFLIESGIMDDKIIVLLLPIGDYWGCYKQMHDKMDFIQVAEDFSWRVNTSIFSKFIQMETNVFEKNGDNIVPHHRKFNHYFYETATDEQKRIIDTLLIRVASKMSNEKSMLLYLNLFRWKPIQVIDRYMKEIFHQSQYTDYVKFMPGDVILNCGVEGGYEIPFFASMVGDAGSIHCVDPLGFEYLHDYVKPTVDYFKKNIFIHRVALMDYSGQVGIKVGGSQSSLAENPADAEIFVPCMTIDGLVEQLGLTRLDLIKLDLEGAERKLLNGILMLCKKFRSQVAISIYHGILDYWEIPLFFIDHLSGYSFYVEHYSPGRYETILYMIPIDSTDVPSSHQLP